MADSVGPSYTDQQHVRAARRTRRWDTTKYAIEMDGSSAAIDNERNNLIPEFAREEREVLRHVGPLRAYSHGMKLLRQV